MISSYNIANKLRLISYADRLFSDAAKRAGASTLQIIIKGKPTFCGGYETTFGFYIQGVDKPTEPYNARTFYSGGSVKEEKQQVKKISDEIKNVFNEFVFLEDVQEGISIDC